MGTAEFPFRTFFAGIRPYEFLIRLSRLPYLAPVTIALIVSSDPVLQGMGTQLSDTSKKSNVDLLYSGESWSRVHVVRARPVSP